MESKHDQNDNHNDINTGKRSSDSLLPQEMSINVQIPLSVQKCSLLDILGDVEVNVPGLYQEMFPWGCEEGAVLCSF